VGDRDRLAQAVENLLLNACRHGGSPVRVTFEEEESTVRLRVDDSGTGVSPDVRSRLFERFASGGRGGTGLGLYIVRQLARTHGGDAYYEPPTSGHSSGTFVLALPRCADERPVSN
jgi:signal transduction histidine kinase